MANSHSQNLKIRVFAYSVIIEAIIGICQEQLCNTFQNWIVSGGV